MAPVPQELHSPGGFDWPKDHCQEPPTWKLVYISLQPHPSWPGSQLSKEPGSQRSDGS